jgi:hypothetical protein
VSQFGHLQELKLLLITDGFNTHHKIRSITKPVTGNREKLNKEQGGEFQQFGSQILMSQNLKHSWLVDFFKTRSASAKLTTLKVIIQRNKKKNLDTFTEEIKIDELCESSRHKKAIRNNSYS